MMIGTDLTCSTEIVSRGIIIIFFFFIIIVDVDVDVVGGGGGGGVITAAAATMQTMGGMVVMVIATTNTNKTGLNTGCNDMRCDVMRRRHGGGFNASGECIRVQLLLFPGLLLLFLFNLQLLLTRSFPERFHKGVAKFYSHGGGTHGCS